MRRRLIILLLFVIPLLVGGWLRSCDLLKPYENGHRGACAAFFALMAKNHLRYGLTTTAGVSILNPVGVENQYFNYYLHHPPGAVLLASIGASLGGTNPSGLRLVFLPLSIGIVLLIYRLARPRGRRAAAAAGGIAALVPIATYYGAFVNFEIPTLFFLLLTLHLYLRYQRTVRPKDRRRMLMAFAAAVGCDWIALGLPFCLAVFRPFRIPPSPTEPPRPRRLAPLLLLVGIAVLVAVKALYWCQLQRFGNDPDAGQGLLYYLRVTPFSPDFHWPVFRTRVAGYIDHLFGLPLVMIALAGLLIVLGRFLRRRLDDLDLAALVTFSIGIANELILASHATGHDYYLLYLMPASALLGAIVFVAGCGPGVTANSHLRTTLMTGSLVVLLIQLGVASQHERVRRESYLLSSVGEKLLEITPEGAVVLLPFAYTSQVAVTANRFVWHARDLAGLDNALQLARRFGMHNRPVKYVLEPNQMDQLDAGLRDRLLAVKKPETFGPYTVYGLGAIDP